MSYASELKPIEPFLTEAPAVPLETDEVAAVRQLADAMSIEDFDLAAYADDYQDSCASSWTRR